MEVSANMAIHERKGREIWTYLPALFFLPLFRRKPTF
jgi:hypothetical protein